MKLTVVIPAMNEEDCISQTLTELKSVLEREKRIQKYEIIVVDDHSTDDTYKKVGSFENSQIKCIRLSKRSGSHIALRAGLREVSPESFALCISADGQDDPNTLPAMLDKLEQGYQIIWALRTNRENESLVYQGLVSGFYFTLNSLTSKTHVQIDQSKADFFLLNPAATQALNKCEELNTSIFGLISWLGFSQGTVLYNRRNRYAGVSKWNTRKMVHMAKIWITAFSGIPLRITAFLGMITSILGIGFAIYLIIHKFLGNPIAGWTSIMLAVLLLGGIQLLMLGVIGEYIWLTLEESRKRPLYIIEKSSQAN
jgi:polyisoprenyl-phosphate glycosyltransferase